MARVVKTNEISVEAHWHKLILLQKGLSMSRSAGLYAGSNDLGPFSHFIDVNGIKIVSLGSIGGQQSVDEKFTLKF